MRLTILLLAPVLCAAPLAAQQPERVTLAGNDVAVYNLVGTIRVVGDAGSGGAVAEVRRAGRDAAKLRVESGAVGGRQTLRVVYPSDAVIAPELGRWSTTRVRVREDGTFGGGRTVTISGAGGAAGRDAIEARADVTLHVPKGENVLVRLAVGEATVTNVDGDVRVDVDAARVTTSGTRGRLSLDTGSGEVKVSGVDGDLDVDAGSGAVSVTGVRGRRMVVDAGSGPLSGGDVTVDVLALDLGSGGARLSNVKADEISLDSGSGSVDLGLAADVSSLVVDSGSGSVTLRVPSSLGATVDVDAGSGGVESDVPMTVTKRSRSELTGQIGDGKGRIKIDAGSGRVRFVKA
jgi:hypothetical protein